MSEVDPDDCEHPQLVTITAQVKGRGAGTTGVIRECTECSGLVFEKRAKIDMFAGGTRA